jgi:hypothetical protein
MSRGSASMCSVSMPVRSVPLKVSTASDRPIRTIGTSARIFSSSDTW